jgi:hypothetical protein
MRRGTDADKREAGGPYAKAAITLSEESSPWELIGASEAANTTETNETRMVDAGCTKEACIDGIVLQQS